MSNQSPQPDSLHASIPACQPIKAGACPCPPTGPNLLPTSDQLYISSILANSYALDHLLVERVKQNESRRKIRFQLMEDALNLGVHQHVLFSAFFYLEKMGNFGIDYSDIGDHFSIGCLALARKYQKGKWPNLVAWRQKVKKNFNKQNILEIESQIAQKLQFELEPTTRFTFMTDLYLKLSLQQKIQHFCSYLLDLSVFLTHLKSKQQRSQQQQAYQFTQAQIGISVVRLSCYFFNPPQMQKLQRIAQQLNYSEQRIHQCCTGLFELLMNRKMPQTRHTRHKYKKQKFMQVAKIQFFKMKPQQQQLQQQQQTEGQHQYKQIQVTNLQALRILA